MNLDELSLAELKNLAKENTIKNYSKLKISIHKFIKI